ncbi:acyl-CoA dehydrogenase family protein [Novosphingobium aquimarinum]|uniref:acyl-CoA dehydrogenase family protein n=1 Tax=Novosphingobium aquimarinum TaxID=2682494 RepID=UPI0018DB9EE8|nr:acyl-CoA dehydrogenase family protein [Novosphingobium aquimarinum]
MQFALTDEQTLVADTARGVFSDFRPALRETMETADGFDRTQWRSAVNEMGFGSLAVPEDLGGSGLGMVELALVMIEMGRTLWPSPFLPSIATALPLILAAAPETMASNWVEKLASGEAIATFLHAPVSALSREGEGWRLRAEGLAPFGHVADLVVVIVEDRIAVLEPTFAGITVQRKQTMDRTRPLASVTIDALLGASQVGDVASDAIAQALDRARVALAAESLGGADAVLDHTVDYTKQRHQFGRPIGSFQALKHRMADMMIAAEAARSAVYYAAAAADGQDPTFAEAAAIAHMTAIETYQANAGHSIQLHGGIGFTWEHDAHLYFKRARSASTLLGTTDQSRDRLAGLVGLSAEAA